MPNKMIYFIDKVNDHLDSSCAALLAVVCEFNILKVNKLSKQQLSVNSRNTKTKSFSFFHQLDIQNFYGLGLSQIDWSNCNKQNEKKGRCGITRN